MLEYIYFYRLSPTTNQNFLACFLVQINLRLCVTGAGNTSRQQLGVLCFFEAGNTA